MADGSVKIEIGADDSGAEKKLDEVGKAAQKTADDVSEMGDSASDAEGKLKETADSASKAGKDLKNLSGSADESGRGLESVGDSATNAGSGLESIGDSATSAESGLNSIGDSASGAVQDLSELKSSASETEREIDDLGGDSGRGLDDLGDSADDAGRGLDDLGDSADDAGKDLDAADVAAGTLAADGLQALMGALSNTVSELITLSDETREYREDMAKLETAFTTAGHSSETATSSYKDFYAILGESDRSVEAINHLAELTKKQKDIDKWSTIAAGTMARFGDSLPIEGLTEAANETAKVGEVTGPLADALNWAGISEETFNEQLSKCNSEQERATLITNALYKEYSAAAEEYNTLTASTQEARLATAEMEETQAELGEALEPVTTAWMQLKTDALQAMLPIVQMVADAFADLTQWMEENPEKAEILKGAILGIATALGILAGALAISSLIELVTKAFSLLNTTLLSNPIMLTVAAVAGLVAAFMYLWENCEGFRNFFIGMWEGITSACLSAWESIKSFFVGAWEGIKSAWSGTTEFFSGIWTGITSTFSSVGSFFGEMFGSAYSAVQNAWSATVEFFSGIWSGIMNVFSTVGSFFLDCFSGAWSGIQSAWSATVDFFNEIWSGIQNVFSTVGSFFSDCFSSAYSGIQSAWSGVTGFFGGIWTGIQSAYSGVTEFFSGIFSSAYSGITSIFSGLVGFFSGLWSNITSIFSTAGTAIAEAVGGAFSWAINGILRTAVNIINGFIKAINGVVSVLNEIPGVSISPVQELSAPQLAKGGVLEKGQVGILEGSGAEAVVPLEKNTKWLNEIADRLGDEMIDTSDAVGDVQRSVNIKTAQIGLDIGTPTTGVSEVLRAMGTQTAGINSLANEFRQGSSNQTPVVIQLDKRELGRAVVDTGNMENSRVGSKLSYGGAY